MTAAGTTQLMRELAEGNDGPFMDCLGEDERWTFPHGALTLRCTGSNHR
jgi:hypothetical protein